MPGPAPVDLLARAPRWRREPYRLFFPLGGLLAWAGVFHWLLHAMGVLADYQSVVHAIVQIQGFMMCFVVGFLFTAIPRRTGTAPPAAWQMVVGLAAPVATTVTAWFGRLALAQAFWVSLVAVLIVFVVARFRGAAAGRRPPHSFIWLPMSFAIGLAGAACIVSPALLGDEYFRLHDLGRLLLLQGMFLGLVVGVGGLALPLITRGEGPPDAGSGRSDAIRRLAHLLGAVLLVTSCWVENSVGQRGGLLLRAGLVLALLLFSARIYRIPSVPGRHRWLVWLSAWMIPAGYLLAAAFPLQARAGLHVVFIGGFALMAFAVGLHVTLAHGGRPHLARGGSWQVAAFGACFLLAVLLRVMVDFDPERFYLWLGASSAVFLAGTIFWAGILVKGLRQDPESA